MIDSVINCASNREYEEEEDRHRETSSSLSLFSSLLSLLKSRLGR